MELKDNNFEQEVLKYEEGPVLVDFHAPWCGPCQMQGPIIEELSKEMQDTKAKVFKLNVDESNQTAQKYGVMSIPTLIIFVKGEPKETMNGLQNKDVLKEKLQALM
ncbi:thioredoxin [Candidatus Falkowbacteria bacterium]|jgi:thioredoxin 1|nr:thioredoxin [Candidatus Falkowbacteria bacterium]MBT5503685.1 thioredoxin [Candidatus Falkowbacteria bacterium]MBT6573835.1 thioredoxin [Candidatus Falkowbacteria bacterium]MBT7348737.1 thioredoxin [Candidatus Falkowbacteria bacterium]MBT7500527.1 thioredoxin [Candidatus Falkowbacteria bacterium]